MLSPRLKNILLYGSTTLMLVIGTALLVAIARGYRYDFLHQRITQTGLVIIDSKPNGATILIDDKPINQKTPYRIEAADIGDTTIKLQLKDYRDWTRHFTVHPEQVSFLDYAWLLPIKLEQTSPQPELNPTNLIQSTDHRKTFFITKTGELTIWQYIDQAQPQKIYTAPPALGQSQIKDIDSLTSNYDGSQLYFRLVSDNSATMMIKNVGGGDAINLSDNFAINTGSIILNPADRNTPYLLDNGQLSRFKLDNKSLPLTHLLDNVTNFTPSNDRAIYTTTDPTTSKTSVYFATNNLDKRTLVNLDQYKDAGPYSLKYSQFRGVDYIYALSQSSHRLLIVAAPMSDAPKTSIYGQAVSSFMISPSGRYIVTNNNGHFNSYDFELGYYYNRADAKLTGLNDWLWLDDDHIIFKADQVVHMIDYDGSNDQTIIDNASTPIMMAYQFDSKSVLYTDPAKFKQTYLVKR